VGGTRGEVRVEGDGDDGLRRGAEKGMERRTGLEFEMESSGRRVSTVFLGSRTAGTRKWGRERESGPPIWALQSGSLYNFGPLSYNIDICLDIGLTMGHWPSGKQAI